MDNDLYEAINELSEEKAKELLVEILSSYAAKGCGNHNNESVLSDVKRIYLKLIRDRYDNL